MAVKVGNSWVSEAAYAYAKQNIESNKQKESDTLKSLSQKFSGIKFSTNTTPFQSTGTNNIAISPNILKQMANDPDKQLEYEALIYDCAELHKSSSSFFSSRNIKAHGFIINSDGSLASWSISEGTGSKNKHSSLLPKNNKSSWLSLIIGEKTQKKYGWFV